MSKIVKLLLPPLFSVISLIIAVVAIEFVFRLVEPRLKPREWSDRPKFYFKAESADTLGDYLYPVAKSPGNFRIAVVGDSFSFAPYMQFTDAFPKKLEQMLNLNATPLKAEVINYGVPAYSTSHEVPVVSRAIEGQADLVLLQITLNDPEIKGHTPIGITDFSRFGPPKLSERQKDLYSRLHSLAFLMQRLHNRKTQKDYVAYFNDLFNNPRTYGNFSNSLKKIVTVCKEKKVPLVAVIFPLFGLPMDDSYPFYPIHEKVDALLASLEVPHTDLSASFRDIPLERIQVIPGVDRHPNEIGHRIAAESIYTWMVSQRLVPEPFIIKQRFINRTQTIKEKPYIETAEAAS